MSDLVGIQFYLRLIKIENFLKNVILKLKYCLLSIWFRYR